MSSTLDCSTKAPSIKLAALIGLVAAAFPVLALAAFPDVADQAMASAFSRDNQSLLCLDRGYTMKEMRAMLDPHIRGIDTANDESFRPLVAATYEAFPCPFAPTRPELERARPEEIVGRWTFPQTSIALRHGPKSPAWQRPFGMPALKCEAVVIQASGAYKVAQVAGEPQCPDTNPELLSKMEALPQVAAWRLDAPGRLRVDRSDVPGYFEEWDVFTVKQPFEIGRFKFNPGELLAYLRRDPKNQINAATVFRHLQPLKSESAPSPERNAEGVAGKRPAIASNDR